jgi:hypothetical protein
MTKLLQKAIEQVEQLPDDEQDAAAGALIEYLAHMRDLQLTDQLPWRAGALLIETTDTGGLLFARKACLLTPRRRSAP